VVLSVAANADEAAAPMTREASRLAVASVLTAFFQILKVISPLIGLSTIPARRPVSGLTVHPPSVVPG
jgi:hypothetical protein